MSWGILNWWSFLVPLISRWVNPMDMKVHCPGCTKSLRVPKTSSGRKARCPNCQKVFVVPAPGELVDETISTWIEDDVTKLEVEHEKQWEAIGSIKSYQRPAAAVAPAGEAQLPRRMAGSGAKAAPTAAAGSGESSTIMAEEDMVPQHQQAPGGTIEVSAAAASPLRGVLSNQQQEQAYPNSLRVDPAQPHLVVSRCDQSGVCFAFDSIHMEHIGFRTSMPVRCAFSGETDRRKFFARPLAFIDRSGARIRSSQEIESKYTTSLLSGQSVHDLLGVIGSIEALPKPFSFSLPYYGTNEFSHSSLKCWTETRNDNGVTCFVIIPNGQTALQWLMNVNGSCGIEYAKLEHDITLIDNDAWRILGEECRRRLAVWCPFEPGEHFQLFLSDGDFGTRDKGLAGLVLTDRRLVYCKYHHRGALDLTKAATLHVRDEADFAQLTIENDHGKTKLVRLHQHDVPTLLEALAPHASIVIDRKAVASAVV